MFLIFCLNTNGQFCFTFFSQTILHYLYISMPLAVGPSLLPKSEYGIFNKQNHLKQCCFTFSCPKYVSCAIQSLTVARVPESWMSALHIIQHNIGTGTGHGHLSCCYNKKFLFNGASRTVRNWNALPPEAVVSSHRTFLLLLC